MGVGPATSDVEALFNEALDAENGVIVELQTRGHMIRLRQRLYSVRYRDREKSKKIYPEGQPGHNRSVWDELVIVTIEEKDNFGEPTWKLRISKPSLSEVSGVTSVRKI